MLPFNQQNFQIDPNQMNFNYTYYQPQMMAATVAGGGGGAAAQQVTPASVPQTSQISNDSAQNYYMQQYQYQYIQQQQQYHQQQQFYYVQQQQQQQQHQNVSHPNQQVQQPTQSHQQISNKKKKEDDKQKFKIKASSKIDIDSFTESLFTKSDSKKQPQSQSQQQPQQQQQHQVKRESEFNEAQNSDSKYRQSQKAANWNQNLSELFTVEETPVSVIVTQTELITNAQQDSFVAEWPSDECVNNVQPAIVQEKLELNTNTLANSINMPVVQQEDMVHAGNQQQCQPQTQTPHQQYPIPYWCRDDLVPLVYKQVYDAATINNSDEIDTNLLYPILLMSNIEKTLLGKIWTLVNATRPGQLVKHELYMALALIALVQSIEILYTLTEIPIPILGQQQQQQTTEAMSTQLTEPEQAVIEQEIKEEENLFDLKIENSNSESIQANNENGETEQWANFNDFPSDSTNTELTNQADGLAPFQNNHLFNTNAYIAQIVETKNVHSSGTDQLEDLFANYTFPATLTGQSEENSNSNEIDLFANVNFSSVNVNQPDTELTSNQLDSLVTNIDFSIMNSETSSETVSRVFDQVHHEVPNTASKTASLTSDDNKSNKPIDTNDKYSFFSMTEENKEDGDYETLWLKYIESMKYLYENVYKLFLDFCTLDQQNSHDECVKIIQSHKGTNFMQCFVETYHVLERVRRSAKLYNIPISSKSQSHINEIDKIFKDLCNLWKYDDHTSKAVNESDQHSVHYCSLCLTNINNYSPIQFSSHFYHNTCINYWLNLVDQHTFPNLKIPSK